MDDSGHHCNAIRGDPGNYTHHSFPLCQHLRLLINVIDCGASVEDVVDHESAARVEQQEAVGVRMAVRRRDVLTTCLGARMYAVYDPGCPAEGTKRVLEFAWDAEEGGRVELMVVGGEEGAAQKEISADVQFRGIQEVVRDSPYSRLSGMTALGDLIR
jgi:hypothetical protein